MSRFSRRAGPLLVVVVLVAALSLLDWSWLDGWVGSWVMVIVTLIAGVTFVLTRRTQH